MHLFRIALVILASTTYIAHSFDPSADDSIDLEKPPLEERALGDIPNPFIWRPDSHHLLAFTRNWVRKPHKAGDKPVENPGISPNNWRHAVYAASDKIARLQQQAHASLTDRIPGSHFQYEETAFQSRGPLREIRFEIHGVPLFQLEYGRVNMILYGLLEYEKIWIKPSKNDQVKMCNFTMYWSISPQYLVAHGRAIITVQTPSQLRQETSATAVVAASR
ncbi:MAG: hypothetical protein LQ339_000710 [Xanthoria mediterranea]|nr:MAG: hypothetical protein LQ339_000710 [Xanthoria mediterranea]